MSKLKLVVAAVALLLAVAAVARESPNGGRGREGGPNGGRDRAQCPVTPCADAQ